MKDHTHKCHFILELHDARSLGNVMNNGNCRIYYNIEEPAGYASLEKSQKARKLKRKYVDWLTEQDT
jgi:hypothetical protein